MGSKTTDKDWTSSKLVAEQPGSRHTGRRWMTREWKAESYSFLASLKSVAKPAFESHGNNFFHGVKFSG